MSFPARAEADMQQVKESRAVTEKDVQRALGRLGEELPSLDREALKDALRGWIARVELDPATRSGRVHYRLTLSGVKVASPRGSVLIPVIGQRFTTPWHRRTTGRRIPAVVT